MGADFLFARPTFLAGFVRNIDLFAVFDRYNQSRTPEEADAIALYSDWSAVGEHLRSAMRTCGPVSARAQTAQSEPEQLELAIR